MAARRMQRLAGIVLLSVAVIAVAVGISTGGTASHPPKTQAQRSALYSEVDSLLTGIPESGTTLGNPAAPVSMTYYGDLECPICQEFTLNTLPQFIEDDVRTGKASVTYRSFCTATCNDYSNGQAVFDSQQVAAYAAGRQGLFWYYAELFYHEQGQEGSGYVTPSFLNGIAGQIPALDKTTWQTDLKDPDLLAQVQADQQTGHSAGVQGTPTLFLKGPKGEMQAPSGVVEPGGYSGLASTIKAVL